MNRLSGKAIAVALALLFFLLASGASVALVIHGVQSFRSGESLTVSQELEQAKAQRELKKEEKALKKTTEKSTTQKSTKKTETKPATTKELTTKKSATKKTTKATTKKISAKASTAKKATTKKATTKQSTTKKSTGTASSGSKVIYLTFDDGPYQYTEKLLGVLEKYDVKATFFVTNAYPGYQDLIGKEYRAGHGVAVHTYSHDYSKVYASDAAYWADFEKMNDIVEKQTGQRSIMFRFPRGSSNTVSK
ncbi:MAG: polysaccharide deacetylase family protein [Clostridia bacterium]|nr:polysaccharide deacetylase family protein [Clostridia bacterium]